MTFLLKQYNKQKEVTMSNLKLIIGREYNTRVRKKSFLATTILIPIVFIGFMFGVMYLGLEDEKQVKVLVADPGGWCGTKIFQEDPLNTPAQFYFYENYIDSAAQFLNDPKFEEYDILISLNEKVPQNRRVVAYYKKNPSLKIKSYIENRIEARIREYFALKKTDLTLQQYNLIQLPFDFKFLDALDPEGKDDSARRATVGFGFAILIYFFIFFYSNQVMRGVIEEKTNRVVEIIISSVKPFHLMLGKITGIGLVGLTQFMIWVVMSGIGLFLLRIFVFPDMVDPANWDAAAMENGEIVNQGIAQSNDFVNFIYFDINWFVMISFFLIYFIGGFLIYSGIFAMIGAMVDSETDTQQLVLPVTMPLILAYLVASLMLTNPESVIGTWFSVIPLTSPIVMVVKVAIGTVSPFILIVSIVLLILTFIATTWMAAKIYRTGILMYGKKASWREVLKWLKYK
ncbi:ABC transporter permease [Putridiphycobacter roseus]|uniref:ABC transporter permease n=1 Tax=Putridiphycobacter roseus TaxID=2219161 RepID=A0A2W1N1A1_9FLAO|nr:ABC transporter permease [Putridiphycobacter roseus]PZE16711.1 ABC transporter permease [Putridiphycobacter roseus]